MTKQLTAVEVLRRVRGCGESEAIAILAAKKVEEQKLIEAYARGAVAVEKVLEGDSSEQSE